MIESSDATRETTFESRLYDVAALLGGRDLTDQVLAQAIRVGSWYLLGEVVREHEDLLRRGARSRLERAIGDARDEFSEAILRQHLDFIQRSLTDGVDATLEMYIGRAGIAAGRARHAADRFRELGRDEDFVQSCELFVEALTSRAGTVPENPANAVQGLGAILIDGAVHYRSGPFRVLSARCFQVAVALRMRWDVIFEFDTVVRTDELAITLWAMVEILDVREEVGGSNRARMSEIYRALLAQIERPDRTVDETTVSSIYQLGTLAIAAALAPDAELELLASVEFERGAQARSMSVVGALARRLVAELPAELDEFVRRHEHLILRGLSDFDFFEESDEDWVDDTTVVAEVCSQLEGMIGVFDGVAGTPDDALALAFNLAAATLNVERIARSDPGLAQTAVAAMDKALAQQPDLALTESASMHSTQGVGVEEQRPVTTAALAPLADIARSLAAFQLGDDAACVSAALRVVSAPSYGELMAWAADDQASDDESSDELTPRGLLFLSILRFEYVLATTAGDLGLLEMSLAAIARMDDACGFDAPDRGAAYGQLIASAIDATFGRDFVEAIAARSRGDEPPPDALRDSLDRALAFPVSPPTWRLLLQALNGLGLAARQIDIDLELKSHLRSLQIARVAGSDAEVATAYTNIAVACSVIIGWLGPSADLDGRVMALRFRTMGLAAARAGFRHARAVAQKLPIDLSITVVERGYDALFGAGIALARGVGDGTLLAQLLVDQYGSRYASAEVATKSAWDPPMLLSTGSWVSGVSPVARRVIDLMSPSAPRSLGEGAELRDALGVADNAPALEIALESIAEGGQYIWFVTAVARNDDSHVHVLLASPGSGMQDVDVAHRPSDSLQQDPPEEVVTALGDLLVSIGHGNDTEVERPTVVCTIDQNLHWSSVASWSVQPRAAESTLVGDVANVVVWPGLVAAPRRASSPIDASGVWAVLDPLGDLRHARVRSQELRSSTGAREGRAATAASVLELVRDCSANGGILLYHGHFRSNDWSDLSGGGFVLDPGPEVLRSYTVLTARQLVDALAEAEGVPRGACLLGCSTGSSIARSPHSSWPALLLTIGIEHVIASGHPLYDTEWLAEQADVMVQALRSSNPARAFSEWQAAESRRSLDAKDRHNLRSLALYSSFTTETTF